MNTPKIMIVDDDRIILESITDYLDEYNIHPFVDPADAINALRVDHFDIVVGDYRMPGFTGLDLFMEGRRSNAYCYGILLTAYADKDLLATFLNNSLINRVLEKPLDLDVLKEAIDEGLSRVLEKRQEERELKELKSRYQDVLRVVGFLNTEIIGIDGGLKSVFEKVKIISKTEENVLITGETGTGKEVFARTIHALSGRKEGPFVKINCGAIPETLIESEIFGHVRGAYSGAYSDNPGKIEMADRGSLFLDEVAELKPNMQTKLLHVIQEKQVQRLGSNKYTRVDFRLITASNRDLSGAIAENLFREDLYYRINTLHLPLPPLREREEDIEPLVSFFLETCMNEIDRKDITVDKRALDILTGYFWPGNIRELENVIKRAVILLPRGERVIGPGAFRYLSMHKEGPGHEWSEALAVVSKEIINKNLNLKRVEREILNDILNSFDGNIMEAVRNTNIPKDKFYRNR